MAKQIVDIGIEGNDNTGDSIRESFRKVNQNFNELYAVFGLGGNISLTDLTDFPDSYTGQEGKVPVVNKTATGVDLLQLASDNALNGSPDSIGFDFSKTGKLIIRQVSSKLSNDPSPVLAGHMDAGGFAIANVDVSATALAELNNLGATKYTMDSLVIDKGYADRSYQEKNVPGAGTRLANEPLDVSVYTKTVASIIKQNLNIPDHGLSSAYNGAGFVFNSTLTYPFGTEEGGVYYARIVDGDTVSLYPTKDDAINSTNRILLSGGTGTFTITDAAYDPFLQGNWLDNVALPRKSVVRRQGDQMEGALILHDHPGELAGSGYDNIDDLQAATKLYVDNVSSSSQINLFIKTDGNDYQSDTPTGKEGRAPAFAYKTLGAAAKKAEELIIAAPIEPGPYMQTITYNNGSSNSLVTLAASTADQSRKNARILIAKNKEFLQKEGIAHIKINNPGLEFDSEVYTTDLGIIIDSVSLDILSGDLANTLSRNAALRYYATPTASKAVVEYKNQTVAAMLYVQTLIITKILTNQAATPLQNKVSQFIDSTIVADTAADDAIVNKFNVIFDIINSGVLNAQGIVDGANNYKIQINNGNTGRVDQGDSQNTDLLPGKIVRGKSTGSIGRIIAYTQSADDEVDELELQLLVASEFAVGEELEFGNLVKTTQITLNVESGIYYEDYPIKLPANVSVNGDEFRRVIIRPKNRVSQSFYANTYLYRDSEFDGLITASQGVPYTNPVTNTVDGYFGYQYLTDPTRISNTGITYSNNGKWETGTQIVMNNLNYIKEQVINYFESTYPTLVGTYNRAAFLLYIEQVINAIAKDLRYGRNEYALETQGNYWKEAGSLNIKTQTITAVNRIYNILTFLLEGQAPASVYGTSLKYPTPDLSYGSAEPADWVAGAQYFKNTVVRVDIGATYKYFKARIVHTAGEVFDANEIKAFWTEIVGVVETAQNLIETVTFAYDADYNPPKHNKDMDVFLMNDATIIRNVTVQGHGGFMCVLDPAGQILTKSPYIQTGSSFSQSLNKQAFRGGMFIDAFVGNSPMNVVSKTGAFRLSVASSGSQASPQGLFIRRPETPCSFYIDGRRFQVNAITDYDQAAGTAELILDKSSNEGRGFTGTTSTLPTGVNLDDLSPAIGITLQTAGNRSMLGNDFTQINDLGYGLVCVNGAISEMVSMFTYYCHASYYAKNGSEIRSLTGSSCYGNFGLVSEGADPNEIPDSVILLEDMVQPGRTYSADTVLYLTGPVSVTKNNVLVQDPVGTEIGGRGTVINTTGINGNSVVYLSGVTGAFNTVNTLQNFSTGQNLGANSVPYEIDGTKHANTINSLSAYVFDLKDPPLNRAEFDVYHPSRQILARYEISNVEKIDAVVGVYKNVNTPKIPTTGTKAVGSNGAIFDIQKTINYGYTASIVNGGSGYLVGNTFVVSGLYLSGIASTNDATITVTGVDTLGSITAVESDGEINIDSTTPMYSGQVYKLNFTTSNTQYSSSNGLLEEISWGTLVNYRKNRNHLIGDLTDPSQLTIRPSTAVVFNESKDTVYRSVSFTQSDSIGNELGANEVQVSLDSNYDYIRLIVNQIKSVLPPVGGAAGASQGATIGDVIIAIEPTADANEIYRLNNNTRTAASRRPAEGAGARTPAPIFSWGGKKYYVFDYRGVDAGGNIVTPADDNSYAIVSILGIEEINYPTTGVGLSQPVTLSAESVVLRAGLKSGAVGSVTINISTTRATSHDFLNVGTGGYNTSNYPNVIYGNGQETDSSKEVQEIGKGRVFYVSTDQDGVFRVGKFFSVDQGTGTVSFAASIALSDLDGLGFKRGVVVTEFSTDSSMSDNATDTVPVESAVRSYVNRRLGFNLDGQVINNPIGPSVMSLGGGTYPQTAMRADMNLGSHKIVNLANPVLSSDAATKSYVDSVIALNDTLAEMNDVTLTSPASASLLAFTGTGTNSINATVGGDVTITLSGSVLTTSIATGRIVNTQISPNASIAQSKLNLAAATTRADAADIVAAERGMSSFDSNIFTAANGWISIADKKIVFNKIQDIGPGTVIGRSAAGTGVASEITFANVVDGVGGIKDSDFNAVVSPLGSAGEALIKTGAGTYGVTAVTTVGTSNNIVKTNSAGSIQVNSLILGGNSANEVLSLSGSTLQLKTPGQGIVLTSSGITNPTVSIPGNLRVGGTTATASTLQGASSYGASNTIATDWIYSRFIEAVDERGAASTGIAIGAGTGKTAIGQVGIVTAKSSDSSSVVPFIFSSTGVVPDVTDVYSIGNSNTTRYNKLWIKDIDTTGTIMPKVNVGVDSGQNIGSTTNKWNTVYATTFSGTALEAYYADLAENYLADAEYEPGTVLVFGGNHEVTAAGEKGTHRVAGVVSTNPATLMNSLLEGDFVIALALQGRVPCKVVGPVKKGDLLVNSGIPGYACVDNNARAGTIVGKSLENKMDSSRGIIEMVVGKH